MKQCSVTLFFFSLILLSFEANAAATLGNPNAPRSARFTENLDAEPATLNPITAQDAYAMEIHGYTCDNLLDRNIDTYEWEPGLAEKIDISKNGKEFTAHLRKGAEFSDGKPITAEDVKFSFDVWFDNGYNNAHMRPYYESIEKAEILDPYTIKFTTKDLYFKNFDVIAGLTVFPKHIYGNAAEGSKMNKSLVCSGPYLIGAYEQGKRIVLKRNPKWWGWALEGNKGRFNFDEIVKRFVKEEQVQLEMLKTGQIDALFPGAEVFVKKMDGDVWEKNVNKFQIQNKAPQGFGFVGWNQVDPLFQDKNVRKALAHLMNRQLMIEKFLFNKSKLATGPWHQDSIYASPRVKPLEFNPKLALDMLSKAGWKDSDKDGVLDKMIDGKKLDFRFTVMNPNKDYEKYLTIFKEDLRNAGIDMDIKYVEWNSFTKLLDEKKFQAIFMGWGAGSVDIDPKQIWHSASSVTGGSNFISYKNPEVDKLIDQARKQMDRKQRVKTLQKVYEIIADDAPYLFLFNRKYTFYATRKNVRTPKQSYNFAVGKDLWWLDSKVE